jgi:hypothetical protein
MPMDDTKLLLIGAIMMGCLTASLFFLRFWRSTRDRFFLFFAISFFLEAVVRLLTAQVDNFNEERPHIYLIRLAAFIVILFAIADKNWKGRSR